MTAAERFGRLPTAAKLLLILTAVLLPIGIALVWLGETGIRQANADLVIGEEPVGHAQLLDGDVRATLQCSTQGGTGIRLAEISGQPTQRQGFQGDPG